MFKKAILWLMITIISIIAFLPYTLAHDLPSYNLSDYITPYDNEVIKLAETIGLKPLLSYPLDNTRNAYYWVSENVKYMYDEQRWGAPDYWQLPSTTIRLGAGDCEDQAILLTSLLRALKLPRENVRLVIGPTERGTYHAWVEIKIPLSIYGLEIIATHAIELLENKKVTISIGEVSYNLSITSATIAEMKTKGLSQRDGWIPLDTTAKLFGLPIPFSWWLTYGYNVYTFLGCKLTPEQTFQDKARIWEESKELGIGGYLSFDIPCVNGDRILGVAKAINAWKTQILEHIQGMDRNVGWSGPFYVRADEKIKVEWSADRAFSVYILTESQFKSWTAGGAIITAPGSYCTISTDTESAVEYVAKYSDNFYAVLWLYPWGYWGTPARVYDWKISKMWQETTCNVQVSISDPEGKILTSISIRQREVEQRFDLTAGKNGIYKVVLRNVGESARIYIRLEEFSTPLSPEVAGISENLVLTEQEYADKIAQTIEENSGGSDLNVVPFSTLIFILAISAITMVSFVLLREKKAPHSARTVKYDHEKVHAIKLIPESTIIAFTIFVLSITILDIFAKRLNCGVRGYMNFLRVVLNSKLFMRAQIIAVLYLFMQKVEIKISSEIFRWSYAIR